MSVNEAEGQFGIDSRILDRDILRLDVFRGEKKRRKPPYTLELEPSESGEGLLRRSESSKKSDKHTRLNYIYIVANMTRRVKYFQRRGEDAI